MSGALQRGELSCPSRWLHRYVVIMRNENYPGEWSIIKPPQFVRSVRCLSLRRSSHGLSTHRLSISPHATFIIGERHPLGTATRTSARWASLERLWLHSSLLTLPVPAAFRCSYVQALHFPMAGEEAQLTTTHFFIVSHAIAENTATLDYALM